MIRNEYQRRRAFAEREELAAAAGSGAEAGTEAAGRRIAELDRELAEYEALRSGQVGEISAQGIEGLGELLVKTRLARGLTISELGELMSMSEQQVGRYEQELWSRASLWRLAQVAEALGLDLRLRAALGAGEMSRASSNTPSG